MYGNKGGDKFLQLLLALCEFPIAGCFEDTLWQNDIQVRPYHAALLTQGVLGVPQDPFAPRRGPLGSSPDRDSAIGNALALVPEDLWLHGKTYGCSVSYHPRYHVRHHMGVIIIIFVSGEVSAELVEVAQLRQFGTCFARDKDMGVIIPP